MRNLIEGSRPIAHHIDLDSGEYQQALLDADTLAAKLLGGSPQKVAGAVAVHNLAESHLLQAEENLKRVQEKGTDDWVLYELQARVERAKVDIEKSAERLPKNLRGNHG